ncbi:periplasmic heavy metal sensor [Marivita sp. GX14005]|uniref:periplasmic heavy metal sensor n=1 Tax=Marivita sp. GX14005 TaxID=2942276 RepID=UPI002018DF4F|nr:periplasmic heavy metal sensor [Marivita sp. GX14005]MCL3882161.1 periplasmic heavy metal sensor [Marivita sp. GX14005]
MTDRSPPQSPFWMRALLVVSLGLNLLVIGALAGFAVTHGPERWAGRPHAASGSIFTRTLPAEERRALRHAFMSSASRPGGSQPIAADLQRAIDLLRETPFDADRFAAAMAEHSRHRAERDEIGRRLIADRIAGMSDAERDAYADRVQEALDRLIRRRDR